MSTTTSTPATQDHRQEVQQVERSPKPHQYQATPSRLQNREGQDGSWAPQHKAPVPEIENLHLRIR